MSERWGVVVELVTVDNRVTGIVFGAPNERSAQLLSDALRTFVNSSLSGQYPRILHVSPAVRLDG